MKPKWYIKVHNIVEHGDEDAKSSWTCNNIKYLQYEFLNEIHSFKKPFSEKDFKFKDYLYNQFFITFIIKLVSLRVSSQNKSVFCDVDELACKYLVL